MIGSNQPEWLNEIWAKSPEKEPRGRGESLAMHTWNVLKRLTDLIRLRLDLPQEIGMPRLWHILFWAAFLHDFGKAASGFQSCLRGGGRWPHRHEILSLAFIDWISSAFSPDELPWVATAIASHHKDASAVWDLYPLPDDPEDDPLTRRVAELNGSVLDGLWMWLDRYSAAWVEGLGMASGTGICIPVLPDRDRAVDLVQGQGTQRIRHWLKTYRRVILKMERGEDRAGIVRGIAVRGYLVHADHSASAHAGPTGNAAFEVQAVLNDCGLSSSSLFGHQATAGATEGSALLTAPTGSGKTEAALLWAARQASCRPGLPRLFYALPYQASMNAMQHRLERLFPHRIGLQHGRGLQALYRLLLERSYDPQTALRQARWTRSLVRLNHMPVRIFSPYQMLKGMYRVKGYEALLSDFFEAAFIFDEIHAYEVKRLALILKTMQYLAQNFRARFLVMSATFPTLIKAWLNEALGSLKEITAEPELFEAFRRHRLVLIGGELLCEEGLNRIVEDARRGKAVLVVCNRVDRAQEAYRRLCERLDQTKTTVVLLHGRLNMRDRSVREKLVRESAGLKSSRCRPVILVATQVVEVSLNIDLDTIYTEPAPMEALIQRFGRVNRQRMQPEPALVHVYRQPADGQGIYDERLIERTLSILDREDGLPLEESAVGGWLDEIYSGETAERWIREYAQAASEFDACCIRTLRPFDSDGRLEQMFYSAFDGIEVLPLFFHEEYVALREEDPILADELLVPVSWRRYTMLKRSGLVIEGEADSPPIVRVDYDTETGLVFE